MEVKLSNYKGRGTASFISTNNLSVIKSTKFRTVMGHSSTCHGADLIESRLFTAMQKRPYSRSMIEPRGTMNVLKRQIAMEYVVNNRFKDQPCKVIHHGMFDVTTEKKQPVEEFSSFIRAMTSDDWFKKLTLTIKTSKTPLKEKEKFKMHSFQRMIMHDIINSMIDRCDLKEHRQLIANYLKSLTGMDNLHIIRIKDVGERFQTRASGYIIPRRCGKSSFSTAMMALCMVLCPAAGLRILYTAQAKDLCKEAFTTLKTNISKLLESFNDKQKAHYDDRIKAIRMRKNVSEDVEKQQYYFQAKAVCMNKNLEISVKFYKFNSPVCIIKSTTPVISTNEFRSKVYKSADAHRGATYNLIFIDETNFISPKIFPEILPNLSYGSAKLICTSSQKNGQDSRPFVNIKNVRLSKVTTNVVEFVCPNHCLDLIRQEQVQYSMCLCNTFQQPFHINTGSDMRKLMSAFSVQDKGDKGNGEDDEMNSKATMLSEIGIMPPGISMSELEGMGSAISKMRMTAESARKQFMNHKVGVHAWIRDRPELVSRTVVAYLDPTPTSYKSENLETFDRSMHAITFVTKVNDVMVVLGVEEFTTQMYERDSHDSMKAMATVFMAQTYFIHTTYDGFFTDIILIPEVNSCDLDNMWFNCQKIYKERPIDTRIMAPFMIKKNTTAPKQPVKGRRKYRKTKLDNGRVILVDTGKEMQIQDDAFEEDMMDDLASTHYMSPSLSALTVTSEELREMMESSSEECTQKYKIGYRMTKDKVSLFLKFFSTTFNFNKFYMADVVMSFSKAGKCDITSFLLDKLDGVVITTTTNKSGKKVMVVSGKKATGKNKHEADDVAVSTVMAASLFERYDNYIENDDEILVRLTV